MGKFNHKSFNERAFGIYSKTIPQRKKNELIKSKVLKSNKDIKNTFSGQTGTLYATIPMYGRIGGEALNYDGQTDITATTTTTFERSVIVIGRSKAWEEKDFSEDITGNNKRKKFLDVVAEQVVEYWDDIDQDTLLAIIKGIFSMTGAENLKFVNNHTLNIATESNPDKQLVGGSTLNTAIQKASGDKKSKFKISIMHSAIATNLENLKLLAYMTYTDADGVERQLELATWNGRTVLIDDGMPAKDVAAKYVKTKDKVLNAAKTYFTKSGQSYTAVTEPNVADIATYYEYDEAHTEYTTYVFGEGAFDYEDIGVEVPHEMVRKATEDGGKTLLVTRQRKVFAPYGISFTKESMATLSPTNAELANGGNWELVNDGDSEDKKYIDHKSIAIARIISRG